MPQWVAVKVDLLAPSSWANDCSVPNRYKAGLLQWLPSCDGPFVGPTHAPLNVDHPVEWG